MTDDNVALLNRATRGDHDAAEEFYRRHAQYVWAIVRRFSLDDDEAMDASQEAFLRVFRGAPFEGRSSLRTWLFRVAASAALDFVQSPRGRQHERLDTAPEAVTARQAHPVDPFLRAKVSVAVSQLPEAQRDVFVMCEMMELSHEECAAQLGIPVGTSRRRLFDAKASLRKTLRSVMEEYQG